MEVSSGSVSEGGLSSPSTEPRGFTTRLNVEPAWLHRPIMVRPQDEKRKVRERVEDKSKAGGGLIDVISNIIPVIVYC